MIKNIFKERALSIDARNGWTVTKVAYKDETSVAILEFRSKTSVVNTQIDLAGRVFVDAAPVSRRSAGVIARQVAKALKT